MAYEELVKCISLRAPSTAYSARQYHMVQISSGTSAGYFTIGTTYKTGYQRRITGILQDAPTVAGEACAIAVMNGAQGKLISGSTKLKVGTNYVCGTSGRAQSTASAVAKEVIYGPWQSAAAAAGSIGQASYAIIGITT